MTARTLYNKKDAFSMVESLVLANFILFYQCYSRKFWVDQSHKGDFSHWPKL